jgi:hypothetical protein
MYMGVIRKAAGNRKIFLCLIKHYAMSLGNGRIVPHIIVSKVKLSLCLTN